jgi:hypothetical protein
MDLEHQINLLIEGIEQAKNYLVRQAETKPVYSELIQNLNAATTLVKSFKPIVKIVSPSIALAENLKSKSLANPKLRSLYEFQTVSPIGKIDRIMQNCDLLCLIYYYRQSIHQHHRRLIELARRNNITSIVLITQPKLEISDASLSNWLIAQNFSSNHISLLSNLFDLDRQQHIDAYQQLLLQPLIPTRNRFIARHREDIQIQIEEFFQQKIHLRRESTQTNNFYRSTQKHTSSGDLSWTPSNKPLNYYRQRSNKIINRVKQEKQQTITTIKQIINHLKTDLHNPFATESPIFGVQQLIDLALLKAVRENNNTYLYLTLDNSPDSVFIQDYIVELCQQKIDEILVFQWWQINYVYAEGGLENLVDKINARFEAFNELLGLKTNLPRLSKNLQSPSFNLEEVIDSECLKYHSRIVFDYKFTQSSWFRLVVSILVGWGIYLFTSFYFGKGIYIGFVIIIFQIINLIIGNDPKKIKLQQQTKELKRIVDRQYQILVRLAIDKSIQALITALEREAQLYQQQIELAIAAVETQLDQSKPVTAHQQSNIDSYERDRLKILSWFDSVDYEL